MRVIDELKKTTNSAVYKKLRKIFLSKKAGLCSLCKYHRGENAGPFKKFGTQQKRKKWRRNGKRFN